MYKYKKKKYKNCELRKYTDGSIAIYSPHRHKGSNKAGKMYFTSLHSGGFRKAKKLIDKWKKP